jgi:NAD(P)H-flavin reductase
MKHRDVFIVAGGIGLAPLRSLVDFLGDHRGFVERLCVFYGAKHPSALLFQNDLDRWRKTASLDLTVIVNESDETWQGPTGMVTEPLREAWMDPDRSLAVVVGPPVMYRFVAKELFDKDLAPANIYFSLERHFKCGIGKCGHCQLNDLYVCQDGPVFRYTDLIGRSEAIETWAPEEDGE